MDVKYTAKNSANSLLYNDSVQFQIILQPSKYADYLTSFLPLFVALLATMLLTLTGIFIKVIFFTLSYIVLFFAQKYQQKNDKTKAQLSRFTLDVEGQCQLNFQYHLQEYTVEKTLSCHSRSSFIGCWLYFEKDNPSLTSLARSPSTLLASSKANSLSINKSIFLFKDSLSEQDFARLARIIKELPRVKAKQLDRRR